MKYYIRGLTEKTETGYRGIIEYIKTNDISRFNRGKKILFYESNSFKKDLRKLEKDRVYKYVR